MFKSFAKGKKIDEDIKLTPMNTSRAWQLEANLLMIYSLLSHRIKGLGWSLSDFWEADTWTTSHLYCMELDIIEEEEKELNNGKEKPEKSNDEEVEDLYSEMFHED